MEWSPLWAAVPSGGPPVQILQLKSVFVIHDCACFNSKLLEQRFFAIGNWFPRWKRSLSCRKQNQPWTKDKRRHRSGRNLLLGLRKPMPKENLQNHPSTQINISASSLLVFLRHHYAFSKKDDHHHHHHHHHHQSKRQSIIIINTILMNSSIVIITRMA